MEFQNTSQNTPEHPPKTLPTTHAQNTLPKTHGCQNKTPKVPPKSLSQKREGNGEGEHTLLWGKGVAFPACGGRGPGVYGIETPEGEGSCLYSQLWIWSSSAGYEATFRMQAWPLSQPGYERAWPPSLTPISSWDAGLAPIPTIHGLELYESVVSFVG